MAETKRVSDQYKISAPSIVIDGNLTITGSTTSVETVNSVITDNIIVLNSGELGAGVTAGSAGIEVERGSLTNSSITWNETDDVWEIKVGGSYAFVRGSSPLTTNDYATKGYVDSSVGLTLPGGPLGSIQINNGSGFDGSANLLWNGSSLLVQDLIITVGGISVTTTDSDLLLIANGTGKVFAKNPLQIENVVSDPSSVSGSSIVYAKTPGNAGTGLFVTNTSVTEELVSRKKAILFGLIF